VEFQDLASRLSADVGVAIASLGSGAVSFGTWSTGVAWSTIKVPLVIAAMRAGVGTDELVEPTIIHSDNATAEELWSRLGESAAQRVQSVMREAGDPATTVESRRLRAEYTPFGQTQWSLADQAQFAARLPQLPDASPVVDLMRGLTTDHRWGLAAKGFAAKGGWGPGIDGGYLIRQFAIVSDDTGVALAAEMPDGEHEAGVDIVNSLADWLVDEVLPK
jgi:hypothetical protein